MARFSDTAPGSAPGDALAVATAAGGTRRATEGEAATELTDGLGALGTLGALFAVLGAGDGREADEVDGPGWRARSLSTAVACSLARPSALVASVWPCFTANFPIIRAMVTC